MGKGNGVRPVVTAGGAETLGCEFSVAETRELVDELEFLRAQP